ncbi:hypothetical protein SCARR_04126 [Pontiella sulfatireligans]|uniref:Restriction endonuclease type IV Mrr domain-containing protein n=2 Tax=Pontiella sulfatireligans TaxID=2750658 RepID=A0A6C2UP52_9BACT|nr:hypothetical protein SCARR_04126 [Pontiella sulfatireligans]
MGVRRQFVSPSLSDFSLNATTYRRCREDYNARQESRTKSDNTTLIATSAIGAVIGGCLSFGAGFIGFILGGLAGGALVSEKQDIKTSQDLLNTNKYDQAVAEYELAVECRDRLLNEREQNVRRQRERERQLKIRLEKQKQEDYWLNLNPYEFEEDVALCLKHCGMVDEVRVTKKSGDEGVDIWAHKGRQKIIIQCKAYASPVGIKDARELLGVKIHLNVPRAILVSRSTFTGSVSDFAHGNGLELIGLEDLLRFGYPRQPQQSEQKNHAPQVKNLAVEKSAICKHTLDDVFLNEVSRKDARLAHWKAQTQDDSSQIKAKQNRWLINRGFDTTNWERGYADMVIKILDERKVQGLATPKQIKWLLRNGHTNTLEMSVEDANKIINAPAYDFYKSIPPKKSDDAPQRYQKPKTAILNKRPTKKWDNVGPRFDVRDIIEEEPFLKNIVQCHKDLLEWEPSSPEDFDPPTETQLIFFYRMNIQAVDWSRGFAEEIMQAILREESKT